MKSLLTLWIKDKIIRTIWLLWLPLSGIVLSLPPKNFLFSSVSTLNREWLYKILLELLLIALGLLISLIVLYNRQKSEISFKTCEWIQDPGIWKHKVNGLNYCPHCAPDPSPLFTDNNKSWFCSKCSGGFGKGEVFVC